MTKDELKQEFEKYLKDSTDYYDPREPLTERKLLQMWLDCAEPREKRIAELKAYNEKLLDGDIEKHNKIAELKEQHYADCKLVDKTSEIIDQLDRAKEIIKWLLKETYGEGWNYSLQVKVEAEKFLKEE